MELDLNTLNEACKNTLAGHLGMKIIECTQDRVVATMPVDKTTHQPLGYLHGGASVALAETVASIGGWFYTAKDGKYVLGLEINANHLRSVREGHVKAIGTPIHIGKSTQVWEVKIHDEAGHLVSVSRCTLAVVGEKT